MKISISLVLILIPSLLRGMHASAFPAQSRKEVSFAALIDLKHAPCLKNVVDEVLTNLPLMNRTLQQQQIDTEITDKLHLVNEEALLEYFLLMNGCLTNIKRKNIPRDIICDLKEKNPLKYREFAFGIVKHLIEQENEMRLQALLDGQRRSSPGANPAEGGGELISGNDLDRYQEALRYGNTQPSTPIDFEEQLIGQQRINRVPPVGMEFLSYMVNAGQDAVIELQNKNGSKIGWLVALCLVVILEAAGLVATGTTRG